MEHVNNFRKVLDLSKTIFPDRPKTTGAKGGIPSKNGPEASSTGGAIMQTDFDEIHEIVTRARAFYESVRAKLETEALHKFVCVNAETGEYVLGDSRKEVHDAFAQRFSVETPSWVTQVGNPNDVWSGARLLQ